jgi:hypothetical protein
MEMAGHTDSYCHQQLCCAKNFQVKKGRDAAELFLLQRINSFYEAIKSVGSYSLKKVSTAGHLLNTVY